MAYGVNAPWGLRPIRNGFGGAWSNNFSPYYIPVTPDGLVSLGASMFRGDPVKWNTQLNYTSNLIEYPVGAGSITRYTPNGGDGNNAANEFPVLGVFWGIKFVPPGAIAQLQPIQQVWVGGSVVQPGTKVIAYIVDDPLTTFSIQVSTNTNILNDARFSAAAGGGGNQPAILAAFGQNFGLGLNGGGNIVNNPADGSLITGTSAYYLNTTFNNNSVGIRTAATAPLRAIRFIDNGQNGVQNIYAADGVTVNPFLNVEVMINNHQFSAGTIGITPA